jgi:hypothetical protein
MTVADVREYCPWQQGVQQQLPLSEAAMYIGDYA